MTRLRLTSVALAAVLAAGCSSGGSPNPGDTMPGMTGPGTPMTGLPHLPTPPPPALDPLPGMPAVTDPHDVDAAAGAGMLLPAVAADKPLVYVPHSGSGDVWVIDPATYQVIAKYPAGKELQHVVPSWDLRTLYATDDRGDHVLPFDPRTGQPGKAVPVVDPYNMYFTPDGKYAISVAERLRKLVWYDPHTWQVHDETAAPDCGGIDHADFSPDGRTAVFTCEFAGRVAVVDVVSHRLLRMIDMPHRNTRMGPQDIKLAPDGSVFYIADSDANGLWVLDGAATHVLRFIPTGRGAHGLYLSRDAKRLYVTNRHEGSVSVLDAYTGAPVTVWHLPGGGSPDMGNVTADGAQLWLSGRYDKAVYVLSTKDGSLIRKIPVGNEPHGLCVWPQPGRYSLGHTGITR
ncbi:beta-propeller fold lactonase family protein [Amycolatopsis mongoliensis]|uniref:Beta-propeller fold lactonase family protein n=1 Tax=Amycolatopsis mongoliensis TaxID=715475 RepID=A0A9Y2JJC3_9PSEU|nr:beta-propeller fold lactonase family protein [Amycolatopsis sp. 4-36]WIX98346.1 beta-propeller fold lactonase family protein [Amycolatopsis sp. 4-36]